MRNKIPRVIFTQRQTIVPIFSFFTIQTTNQDVRVTNYLGAKCQSNVWTHFLIKLNGKVLHNVGSAVHNVNGSSAFLSC